jgi:thioesterase domain-containing protein
VDFFVRLFKSRLLVIQNYTAQKYPGRITLLLADEESASKDLKEAAECGSDPTRGWAELSTEPVDIYHVSGNHTTICLEPHVHLLAERLKACLDKSQQIIKPRQLAFNS